MPFSEFLERQGGHICVSIFLILLGAVLHQLGVPKGEDLVPFALGLLGRSMWGKASDPAKPDEVKP